MISTLNPGRAHEHFSPAGSDGGGGFNSHLIDVDGCAAEVFLGLIFWESDDARESWYEDYSRMSKQEVGWVTDGLTELASLGVQSFCLRLSQDSREVIRGWEGLRLPCLTGGAKP